MVTTTNKFKLHVLSFLNARVCTNVLILILKNLYRLEILKSKGLIENAR